MDTPESREYRDQVDAWVQGCLTGHPLAWDAMLRALPGVYPAVVLESIQRRGLADRIVFTTGDTSHGAGLDTEPPPRSGLLRLPTPHPLDFCWWFDVPTVQLIVSLVNAISTETAHVVLLGVPTVFERATRSRTTRALSLVDSDTNALGCFRVGCDQARVVLADVTCDAVSLPAADLVIADPPWYPPQMRSFLWTARQLCDLGGYVVTSVPPQGTRPGIEDEWQAFCEWAAGLGLALRKYEPGVLAYLTPLFEENALAAAGVPVPARPWRRGDLATFQCVDACHQARPLLQPKAPWRERTIDDVRVRIRTNGCRLEWSDPTLHRIAGTDVFPTVSQRDARRGLSDLWTSGNRAFACQGPKIALEILGAIASNSDPVQSVETALGRHLTADARSKVGRTEARLRTIMEVERAELAAWKERHARVDVITR